MTFLFDLMGAREETIATRAAARKRDARVKHAEVQLLQIARAHADFYERGAETEAAMALDAVGAAARQLRRIEKEPRT
jgi:hypothetical protein